MSANSVESGGEPSADAMKIYRSVYGSIDGFSGLPIPRGLQNAAELALFGPIEVTEVVVGAPSDTQAEMGQLRRDEAAEHMSVSHFTWRDRGNV